MTIIASNNYKFVKQNYPKGCRYTLSVLEVRDTINVLMLKNISEIELLLQFKRYSSVFVPYYMIVQTFEPLIVHTTMNETHCMFNTTDSFLLSEHIRCWDDEIDEQNMLASYDGALECIYMIYTKVAYSIFVYRNTKGLLCADGINITSVGNSAITSNIMYSIDLQKSTLEMIYNF